MKKTFLYVKETPLGLKYLGKTTQDPYTYKGSGIYWNNHLKKNNFTINDIKTTILFETTNHNELKEMGLYYSELYNVVDNKKWANLKPEIGDGGGGKMKDEVKEKIKKTMKGKKLIWSEETIKKRNEKLKGRKMPPCSEETKLKISLAKKGKLLGKRSEESIIKSIQTKKINGYKLSEESKLKIKEKLIGKKRPKEVVEKFSKKITIDGITYSSITEACKILNKSYYFLKKEQEYNIYN